MLLTHELTQPIVDKTMAIIKKNINIMDHQAVIIASGDRNRLGAFHEGAAQVIRTSRPLEIHLRDVGTLQGVRPGVNLPITFTGSIIGVVGISGEPEETRSSGELVRTTVELMLEQLVLKEQIRLETRAKESFLHDLLSSDSQFHGELFQARATILNYDLFLPRYAVVIDVDQFSRVVKEKLSSKEDMRDGELALQQLKDRIFHSIERVFPVDGKEIVGFAGGDKFVVLKAGNPKAGRYRHKEEGMTVINKIKKEIQRDTGLAVTVGVGSLYTSYDQYPRSFEEALGAIRIGQRLWGGGRTYWADEMVMESLVTVLPEEVLRNYVQKVLGMVLMQEDTPKQRQDMLSTLEALFEHGLNVTRAARALLVHRNTVLFRLEKLKEVAGYRPALSFKDAMELKLAVVAWRYLKFDEEKSNLQNSESLRSKAFRAR